jgi:hypothetical protein
VEAPSDGRYITETKKGIDTYKRNTYHTYDMREKNGEGPVIEQPTSLETSMNDDHY